MSALDVVQILVFIFVAGVFTYSAVITRKRRKLTRQIEKRTALLTATAERLEAENLATLRSLNIYLSAKATDPQYGTRNHVDRS